MPINDTGGAGIAPLVAVPGPSHSRDRCDVPLLGRSVVVAKNTQTYASILQGSARSLPPMEFQGVHQAKISTLSQPRELFVSQLLGVTNLEPQQVPERPVPIKPAFSSLPRGPIGARERPGFSSRLIERAAEVRKKFELYPNRNVAVARFTIDGKSGELVGISGARVRAGTVGAPQIKMFDTIRTGDNSRELDSEYKILSEMAAHMTDSSRGHVDLYSELRLCVSCDGVVEQFRRKFPDVVVNVTTGRPRQ